MIGKIFKFIGITFAVLIVSLLIFVNTNLFDKFLASKIKENVLYSTGLELNFSRFYVSLFKGKLEAEGISLGNVLKIKKLYLDISSLKLFFAKLDIEKARVLGVEVNIDRSYEIKGFSKNPKNMSDNGFDSVIVRDFRLEDVTVRFDDRNGNVASFVSKDFLIQAGFNDKDGTYSGVIAFDNGSVVYNDRPYLLNVACYFEFGENALIIKELSIGTGGLRLKSKGRFASKGNSVSVEGLADLFELTGIEELKGIKADFSLNGDLSLLKGKIKIFDGEREASGLLSVDIKNKKVKITSLKGEFKQHVINVDASLSFKKKLEISITSSIKGKYFKNFHVNADIVKDKDWYYNARFYGVDCGDGVCGVKVVSGKVPKLSNVKLNLPILKTDIRDNTGWVDLNMKQARVFAHGDFFKNGRIFSGLLTVKKLNFQGMDFPQTDLNLTVYSKDKIDFKSILLKHGEGTARLKGSYFKENLNLKGKLSSFPFQKTLFFLDKETLKQVEIFGAVSGNVEISGKYDNPNVKGTVNLMHTNIYGLFFSSVNTDFVYSNKTLVLDKTLIESGGGFLKGGGKLDFNTDKINLDFKGKDVELNYIPLEDLYAEGSTGSVKIFGTLTDLRIESGFKIEDVVFSGISLGGGNLSVSMKNNDVNIDFSLLTGLSGKGVVKNGETLNFDFKAKNFKYSDDVNDIVLSGVFALKGMADNPDTFEGNGFIDKFQIERDGLINFKSEKIAFSMKGMNIFCDGINLVQKNPFLDVRLKNLKVGFEKDEISSDVKVNGDALFVNEVLKKQDIEGVYVTGNLAGDFKLYGVIYSPFYSGNLQYNGNIDLKDAGYLVKDAFLKANLDYDVVEIKTFKGNIKDGNIEVKGTVVGTDIDLQAKINNVPVDIPGFYADAYGILFLKSDQSGERYDASGYIQLKNGILKVEQMLSGEGEESFLDLVDLNLKTSLEGISYSDNDVNLLFGKSNLKMIGTASSPVLQGIQYISRDSYLNIGDNRFFVEKGKLVFNNPLENNPYVDIVASADISNYKIRCILKGSSEKINLKFASDPPMSQNKILSVLFGGGINTGIYDFYHMNTDENLSGVGAALALNTILSSFNSKMKKTLKVDRFSISSQVFDVTRSPSPVVSFEKSISSRLSFLYAQSLDAGDNLAELAYHMAGRRNIYIRSEIDGSITIEFEIIK